MKKEMVTQLPSIFEKNRLSLLNLFCPETTYILSYFVLLIKITISINYSRKNE